MSFDGATQYGEYDTGNTDNNGLGAVTISVDVKITVGAVTQVIFAKGDQAYRLYVDSSNIFVIGVTSTGVSASIGAFNKLSVTFNSAGDGVSLSVDGVIVWTGLAAAGTNGASSKFFLGSLSSGPQLFFLNGTVANFQITGDTKQHWDLRDNGLSALTSGTDLTLVGSPVSVTDNTIPVDPANERGFTDDNGTIYLARADDPSTDVLGNPTQWQGSAYPVRPVERQSNALSFDGATQSMTVAALTGSETVVSSEGTSTPTISAGTIDFTAGTCSNLVLSNGFVFNMAEGAGSTAYSTSGNGNHGTLVGNPTWVLEDGIPSSNLDDGFSLYEHASLDPIRVPYGDNGQPLTITPPTGYTKTSDNAARKDGHNDAETELDFYNIATDGGTTPAIVASGVVLTDYSFGQMLLNPMFKRTISSVLEDRHTLFAAVLTGECLETANEYTDQ
jgi:hypothetical protein